MIMQSVLLIDNYDSFTYNLVHYLQELGESIEVVRNDAFSVSEIKSKNPKAVLISPGPGEPKNAGICIDFIKNAENIPVMGVCLGHQAIGEAFGGKIIRAEKPMHGKTSMISHSGKTLFQGLPSPFIATRYHSLVIDKATLPDCLEITATTEDGTIMAISHTSRNIHGVQFHPESIASEHGHKMLKNFLEITC